MQNHRLHFLKNLIPELKFVEYFSDGCAAQYKNRKCFYNLCLHEKEFGVKEAWSFLPPVTANLHVMALVEQ